MNLEILRYPDPLLKRQCAPVEDVNDAVRKLVDDMLETMVASKGVGLAAPQVGYALRLFVVNTWWPEEGYNEADSLVFINPEIVRTGGTQRGREGCLSLPGVGEHVTRAKEILVRARARDGAAFELEAEDFLAVAIQHENDHLNGVLMLDRLSPMVRKMAVKKLV